MDNFNDIGISNKLDARRIRKLLLIGLMAALIAIAADMILGWNVVSDGSELGTFSKYIGISDKRIFWSALLGLIGIPLETLAYFGVYRLFASKSIKRAHTYRTGIIGILTFGSFTHVVCCAAVYYLNRMNDLNASEVLSETLRFTEFFLAPVSVIFFAFYLIFIITHIIGFAKGDSPLPKWCAIFNPAMGIIIVAVLRLFGNHEWVNALSTGWISIGGIFTFAGLLIACRKHLKEV